MATRAKSTPKTKKPTDRTTKEAVLSFSPRVVGSPAAYARFEAAAKALPASAVVRCNVELQVAHANVIQGVKTVLAHEAQVTKELGQVDLATIKALPELSLATVFAGSLVAQAAPVALPEALLARNQALRSLLLDSAQSLATAGIFPAHAVVAIRHGRGKLDAARDTSALAALFAANAAAVRGRTPVTEADVREASAVSAELQALLTPRGAKRTYVSPEATAAADMRDRMYTLLVQRHDILWRVGAWLFGRSKVAKLVPQLASRVGHASAKPATTTPAAGSNATAPSVAATR